MRAPVLKVALALAAALLLPASARAAGPVPADGCPTATKAGHWARIPPMPGRSPRPARVTGEPTQPPWRTVFALGRLYVFTAGGHGLAFDPCRGAWARFPSPTTPAPPAHASPDPDPALDSEMALAPTAYWHLVPELRRSAGTRGHPLQVFDGAVVKLRRRVHLTAAGAPAPRAPRSYVLAAAGDRVIVWGGRTASGLTNRGAVFDAKTRRWRPMTTAGAPSPRESVRVVWWTGRRLVVWGGRDAAGARTDGAAYDPVRDRWRALPAAGAPTTRTVPGVAVASGRRLVVLPAPGGDPATGGVYDRVTNRWRPVAPPQGTWPGYETQIHRDGPRRLVFADVQNRRLEVLDLTTGRWTGVPFAGAHLSPRTMPAIHWTGARLVVFGGVDRKMVSPGGGCGGPRPPGMGCDPVPPIFLRVVRRDGAIYRPRPPGRGAGRPAKPTAAPGSPHR